MDAAGLLEVGVAGGEAGECCTGERVSLSISSWVIAVLLVAPAGDPPVTLVDPLVARVVAGRPELGNTDSGSDDDVCAELRAGVAVPALVSLSPLLVEDTCSNRRKASLKHIAVYCMCH